MLSDSLTPQKSELITLFPSLVTYLAILFALWSWAELNKGALRSFSPLQRLYFSRGPVKPAMPRWRWLLPYINLNCMHSIANECVSGICSPFSSCGKPLPGILKLIWKNVMVRVGKMEEKKRRASLSSLVSFIFFSFLMHLFRVSSLFDKWMLRIGKRALVSYVSVIFFHHLDWHLWLRRLVQQQFRLQAWLPCWLCYSLLIYPPVMLLFFGQWTGSCKTRDISVY